MTLPDPAWTRVGETANAEFYAIRSDVLAVIPHVDTRDVAETARESLDFQRRYWTERGHGGAAVVFMDRVLEQDAGARQVYAEETHDVPTTCYALVGESFFAQATSAVFMGLAKPARPTQVFASLAEALEFVASIHAERGAAT